VGEGPVGGQTMEEWMWTGGAAEEAWKSGLGEHLRVCTVSFGGL